MKDVVVQGEGQKRMVCLLLYGKVVAGDRWRCGVSLRGLPKKNGGMGEVPVGGGFVFLREDRGR